MSHLLPGKVVTISANDGDNYFVWFGAPFVVFSLPWTSLGKLFVVTCPLFWSFVPLLWAIGGPKELSPSAPRMVTTILSDSGPTETGCLHVYLDSRQFEFLYSSPRYHNKAVRVLCWDNLIFDALLNQLWPVSRRSVLAWRDGSIRASRKRQSRNINTYIYIYMKVGC